MAWDMIKYEADMFSTTSPSESDTVRLLIALEISSLSLSRLMGVWL